MNELKYFAIIIVGMSFCISFGATIYRFPDSKVEIEAIKNGLVQCVDDNKVIWQKECNKH